MQEAVEAGWAIEMRSNLKPQLSDKTARLQGQPSKWLCWLAEPTGAEKLPQQGYADVQLIHQWTH
jgi:hypothetical protein